MRGSRHEAMRNLNPRNPTDVDPAIVINGDGVTNMVRPHEPDIGTREPFGSPYGDYYWCLRCGWVVKNYWYDEDGSDPNHRSGYG